MRDRLIAVLGRKYNCVDRNKCLEEQADHILADGWIRPHCNLGDTLYVAFKELSGKVEEIHIKGIEMCRYDNQPNFVLSIYEAEVTTGNRKGERIKFAGSCFDRKEVCFSKEDALEKLKEGGKG